MTLELKPQGRIEVEIPYGVLEYTAIFKKPVLEGQFIPAKIIGVVLEALNPWGFKLDGVELKTRSEKLSDQAIVFRRTNPATPGLSLTLGFGKVLVSAENVDWSEAQQLIEAIAAAMATIIDETKAEIESQHVGLGMHIQLKTRQRNEVTAPLLSPLAYRLLDGDVKFPGIILQREKSSVIIDASAAYANALFVRMFREHRAEAPLQELADTLLRDERQLFEVLGLEGTL